MMAPSTDHPAPQGPAAAEAAADAEPADDSTILTVLPPQLLSSVLLRLWDCPQALVAFSLASSQAHSIAADDRLWAALCRQITSRFPKQLRSVDWGPSAWGVGSHRELCGRLLHPYGPLLQQRVWHTSTMPEGQLLVVDAQSPCLVGRSLHFKGLNDDDVLCHPVFVVRLCAGSKSKARVYCSRCRPVKEERRAACAATTIDGRPPKWDVFGAKKSNRAGLECTDELYVAELQLLPQAAGLATAACRSTATAAAADSQLGGRSAVECVQSSGSSSSTSQQGPEGTRFHFSCSTACGELHDEDAARSNCSRPYSQVGMSKGKGGSAAGGAAAPSSSTAAGSTSQPAGAAASQRADSGSCSAGSRGMMLPGIDPKRSPDPVTELMLRIGHPQRVLHPKYSIPGTWRSQATYQPLTPSTWLLTPGAAADTPTSLTADGDRHAAAGTAETVAGSAALAAAGLGLAGLWVGVFPDSSAQLVQLQLLAAPPGYMLQQEYPLLEPPQTVDSCPTGVLLRSVLHIPAPESHPDGGSRLGSIAGSSADVQGLAAALQRLAAAHQPAEPAAAADADSGGARAAHAEQAWNRPATSSGLGGQEDMEGRQLLLVGTKVTGDRQVPAGQVSFAVDLGSRSSAGAGQLLAQQLPESAVRASPLLLGTPGTRPLVIKERFAGLAQVAKRERPVTLLAVLEGPPRVSRIAQVELLVLQDPDCLALWWRAPINSVSLFSRRDELAQ